MKIKYSLLHTLYLASVICLSCANSGDASIDEEPAEDTSQSETPTNDSSDNGSEPTYASYLDVTWTPINTHGVDAYDENTMQGITKGRDSVQLSEAIPHTDEDIYNLVDDFQAVSDTEKDQSTILQNALDYISGYDGQGNKGGILIVPAGKYHIKDVRIRSNTMILCKPGATFAPYIPNDQDKKLSLFVLGKRGEDKIDNVGIRGIEGSRLRVELPAWEPGITVFDIGKVENYIFSDIDIYDNKTVYCCFGIGPGDVKDHTDFPRSYNGYIGNCSAFNCHFGYGLMQIQSAHKLHVEHCYSSGGVCYRTETGWNLMNQYSTQGEGGVFDLTAYDITCENGATAVMMSPHSQQVQGTVCVEKVRANSCMFGVLVSAGFVYKIKVDDKKEYAKGYDASGNLTVRLTPGKFNAQSFIRDIDVTFGMQAQCRRWPEFDLFMPDEYMQGVVTTGADGKSLKFLEGVASVAPLLSDSEEAHSDFSEYGYAIDWSQTVVTHHGFKYNNGDTIEGMNPKQLR